MNMKFPCLIVLVLACFTLSMLAGAAPVQACPNCKVALSADDSQTGANLTAAYGWTIIGMLGLLATLAFSVIRVMMVACRQSTIPVPIEESPESSDKNGPTRA